MKLFTPLSDQISPSGLIQAGRIKFSSDINPWPLQTRSHAKQGMEIAFNFLSKFFTDHFMTKLTEGSRVLVLPGYKKSFLTSVRNDHSPKLAWRRASAGHWHYGTFWLSSQELQLPSPSATAQPPPLVTQRTLRQAASEPRAVVVIQQDLCPFNCYLLNGCSDEPAGVQSSQCHLLSSCQMGFFIHLPPAALQPCHCARISKWFQLLGGDPRSTEYSPDQNHAHFLPCAPADTFLNEYCCVCWLFYGLFTSWACNIVRVMLFIFSWKNYCFRRLNAFGSKGSL